MDGLLRVFAPGEEAAAWAELRRGAGEIERAERLVAPIVAEIRRQGDRAVARWTRKLEGANTPEGKAPYRIPAEELAAAWRRAPRSLRQALTHAHRNIRQMARWQMPRAWMRAIEPGVRIGQVVRPLASAGCYVPGGRHPLPSTVLMTAAVARAAGVGRVVVTSPSRDGAILAAAHLAGADEVYTLGGAVAVAALAYGTASLPGVDKIVGPGNIYVTAAKKWVRSDCAIDFLAGPTEVLLVANRDANPAFVAADMIAQAEHDPQAAAWLFTDSPALARKVNLAVSRQLERSPNPVASSSLQNRGAIVVTKQLADATAFANRTAPEHISVPRSELGRIVSAGSIFVGDYAPEAAGDYMSGTNHVLPTGGGARWRGGLSVLDFVKIVTVQELTRTGLARLAPDLTTLARAEGLEGHAASVEIRLAQSQATPGRAPARVPSRRKR